MKKGPARGTTVAAAGVAVLMGGAGLASAHGAARRPTASPPGPRAC